VREKHFPKEKTEKKKASSQAEGCNKTRPERSGAEGKPCFIVSPEPTFAAFFCVFVAGFPLARFYLYLRISGVGHIMPRNTSSLLT